MAMISLYSAAQFYYIVPMGNNEATTRRILLIEDEPGIAQTISIQLQLFGFSVYTANNVQSALQPELLQNVEVIILDWMLPDGEGPAVIPQIRKLTSSPILMLTARSEIVDKLVGFEAGADDYLTKPFDMMELIARIKALIRRNTHPSPKQKSAAVAPRRDHRRFGNENRDCFGRRGRADAD